jgi:23S rRNA (uracil1939-C5)-methyltransferase
VAVPVSNDQELELRIESLAYGGNGVARVGGFVLFVRRGLPGDRVRARVTKVRKNHAEAVVVDVLEPGDKHVEAPCAHFPECGGCRFQDLAYEAQLEEKHRQVRDALIRIAGVADPVLEPVEPAESVFNYRNKLEYSFLATPKGTALGFHRSGRWDALLEVERCWLTSELGDGIRNAVRDWAREERLEAYDQTQQRGYLRHLVVREGRNSDQALVLLVTGPGERFDPAHLVDTLRAFPQVCSIWWAVNETPAETTAVPAQLLWGGETFEERLGGLRFRLRPNAFLQTNTAMAERLYTLAGEYAQLSGAETLWDLYCGTGVIALLLAAQAASVWGLEVSEESVACAIENAELNGIGNVSFFAGNVGQAVQELLERSGTPDVVVVDPPRAGLAGKALPRLGRIGAPRVVYVSCNPTTLAGDLRTLRDEHGYRLVRARAVDMFPHTPHVETVALLEHD